MTAEPGLRSITPPWLARFGAMRRSCQANIRSGECSALGAITCLHHLAKGPRTLCLELKVAATQQELTVQENSGPALDTETASNASALVLKGKDLDALADDPEGLATDLEAVAGPAAGPDGGSIYIDGFSGGQLPPKDAIREIRINQNPFSPECDKLGCGRVEILTKPGANKFHRLGSLGAVVDGEKDRRFERETG